MTPEKTAQTKQTVQSHVENIYTAIDKLRDFLGMDADSPSWVLQVQALNNAQIILAKAFPYEKSVE